MQWNSVSDFLAMGGYGFYVWGSYGVTLAAMVGEMILVARRRRQTHEALREELSAGGESD